MRPLMSAREIDERTTELRNREKNNATASYGVEGHAGGSGPAHAGERLPRKCPSLKLPAERVQGRDVLLDARPAPEVSASFPPQPPSLDSLSLLNTMGWRVHTRLALTTQGQAVMSSGVHYHTGRMQ